MSCYPRHLDAIYSLHIMFTITFAGQSYLSVCQLLHNSEVYRAYFCVPHQLKETRLAQIIHRNHGFVFFFSITQEMKPTLHVKLQGSTQSLIAEETVSQKSQMTSFR